MTNKRIPQPFINEILARTDIAEVIGHRIQLQKKGNNLWACCPFHNEKSPSFSVNPQKQMFHCFGCKKSGNAIGFLMDHDGMPFLEALDTLASPLGLTLPRSSIKSEDSDYTAMQQLADAAANLFRNNLKKHPKAVDYLKSRGLTGEIVKHYGIGYAPPGWENLLRALGGSHEQQRLLTKAGLLIQKDNGESYDRFRDRIIFPIRNTRGDVIAFGGRILDQGEPKYLNSPESALFQKRSELYGLYEARQANRKLERLLVVEGYMDVVALAQFGISNAVATLGTAATLRHIHLMLRYTHELVFCFDGDTAGQKAAEHALEVLLPVARDDITVRFMRIPEGEDPDSLVRKIGVEAFNNRVESAMSLSEFFFKNLNDQHETDTMEGKAHLGQHAMQLISQMPASLLQSMMIGQLSQQVNMSEEKLRKFITPRTPPRTEPITPPTISDQPKLPRVAPAKVKGLMESILSLLIQNPAIAKEIKGSERLAELEIPGTQLLIEILTICNQNPEIHSAALLSHWQDQPETLRMLNDLATKEHLVAADLWAREINDSIKRLFEQNAELESKRLMALAQRGELDAAGKQRLLELLSS